MAKSFSASAARMPCRHAAGMRAMKRRSENTERNTPKGHAASKAEEPRPHRLKAANELAPLQHIHFVSTFFLEVRVLRFSGFRNPFSCRKIRLNENAEEEFLAASSAVPSATHPHSRGRTRGGDRFLRGTRRNAIGVDFLLRFPCLPEGTYCLTNGGEIARIHAHHAARSRHAFSLSLTVHRHPMHGCGAFCAHGLQGNAAQRQTDGGLCAATRGCPARLHTPG